MKNQKLSVFEQQLSGRSLEAAMSLREADKRLAGEVAPLMKEVGELQAKMKELQSQLESRYVQFDKLRVEFFKALEAELGLDLDGASLDFRGADIYVVRTQEDLDRMEFFRNMQKNPTNLLRQALEAVESGEAELAQGCGSPDCQNCATKH